MSSSPQSQNPGPAQDVGGERTTRPEDKVSFREKLALGTGYFPLFMGNAGVKGLTIPFYQMTLKVDPALLGLALALPRFWDAMVDTFVGYRSDNCHSRFGRRKPFIVLAAIAQGIAFGAIWMVPTDWSETAKLGYLVASLMVFYTCFSFFSVPLNSLSYEMTPDYKERTRVAAFGAFFGKLGEILYQWIFPLTSLAVFASVTQGMQAIGWIVAAVVMIGFGVLPGLFVKERYFKKAAKQEKVRFLPSVKASFQNRAFQVLVGLTLCQIIAGMLTSSIDYYLLVYHMCHGNVHEGSVWKAILSTGYAVIGVVGIYPVSWLANRYGKMQALVATFALVAVGAIGKWILYTPGNLWKILLDPLFCGPVWIAINILLPSMLADICDDDELRHGMRREGMFGSIFSWITKTGYSLSFFGTGWALKLAGFDAALGGAQSESTVLWMRIILAGGTALWAALALGLLALYPINRDKAYATRDALEARRGTL